MNNEKMQEINIALHSFSVFFLLVSLIILCFFKWKVKNELKNRNWVTSPSSTTKNNN